MSRSAARTIVIGSGANPALNATVLADPLRWHVGSPGQQVDNSIDITAPLGDIDDTVASVSVSASPSGAGELVLMSVTAADGVVTLVRSGGLPGRNYTILIDVTTAAGTKLEYEVGLLISPARANFPLPDPPSLAAGTPVVWADNGILALAGGYVMLTNLDTWSTSDEGLLPGAFYAAATQAPAYIYAVPGFGQIPGPAVFYGEISATELLALGAYPLPQTDPHVVKQFWLNGNILCASLG